MTRLLLPSSPAPRPPLFSRLSLDRALQLAFVRRGEAAAAGAPEGGPVPGFGPAEAAPVARDFSDSWQAAVETIHREVSTDFGGGDGGAVARTVLQAAFTQLLLHYSRFLELLKRQGGAGQAVAAGAVTLPAIMYGLKQYR